MDLQHGPLRRLVLFRDLCAVLCRRRTMVVAVVVLAVLVAIAVALVGQR